MLQHHSNENKTDHSNTSNNTLPLPLPLPVRDVNIEIQHSFTLRVTMDANTLASLASGDFVFMVQSLSYYSNIFLKIQWIKTCETHSVKVDYTEHSS